MRVMSVGSASPLKISAVRAACRRAGVAGEAVPVAATSGVPMQPVGRDETLRGARNRARAAAAAGGIGVGIENGIVREGGRWLDIAAVVIVAPGQEAVAWSEAVELPEAYVMAAEARGFGRTTVGAVIAEATGCAPDNPHAFLTGGARTRGGILADALVEALSRFADASSAGGTVMKATHRIEIGGVVRDLPVREVAPGVRVALFDILGDWELTEAAGKALAARIPDGVDALVMPDGKATALLHVMGRESGAPTFVARKAKKPYMAEPIVSATYRSITTDREQTLHLGADEAAALAGKRVVIADDVVSTGGTLVAMRELMKAVGAEVVGVMAVFTEGGTRPDVTALGDIPLF